MKIDRKILITNILIICLFFFQACKNHINDYISSDYEPQIFPEYINTTIPYNIAPLNFTINEAADKYFVKIFSSNGNEIIIKSNNPNIKVDKTKWHSILQENKGNKLYYEIYTQNQNKWTKHKLIENNISEYPIDKYLVYRLINTGYVFWYKVGIYQRNLENFDETPVYLNSSAKNNCVNCHSFCKNNPDKMIMHLRDQYSGTIIVNNDNGKKINTKTDFTMSAGVYPAWHPDGKHIAFSVNRIGQYFTSFAHQSIDVSDNASDLVIYDIEKNVITTSPKVSTKSRENLPNWSPDGKMLYFIADTGSNSVPERIYNKYSLLRIPYNAQTNQWGDIDTVISASKAGFSVSFPKISPNGKYLVFCASDHGYFTIHNAKTDLYILNIETKEYKKLDNVNSSFTESYHSWSSDGHWLVFSSKRIDGLYSRPYFSYINEKGEASKPFVLPQEDPKFYNTFLRNYNVPELITDKIKLSDIKFRDLTTSDKILNAQFDKTVDIDALSGASKIDKVNKAK